MIQTPYKLNFTWEDDYSSINIFEPIPNDLNNRINKFDSIVLNLHSEKKGIIRTKPTSGFDILFEITNHDRINNDNYYKYIYENGIIGPIHTNQLNHLKEYIEFNSEYIIFNTFDLKNDLGLDENNDSSIDYANMKKDGKDYSDFFIAKWNDDRKYFEKYLPQIYFYGEIYDVSGKFLSNYYISDKPTTLQVYGSKCDFKDAIIYFKNLLKFVDKISSHKYIYRNFNSSTIGLNLNKNLDPDVKIIRYNPFIFIDSYGDFYKKMYNTRCGSEICVGELVPYYIVKDYFDLESKWIERLDKFFALGFVEIILLLFYNNDENSLKLYKFVLEPSELEPFAMKYFHIYNRYNNYNNIKTLNSLIYELVPRYCNINPLLEKCLSDIILNLLDKDYERIPYPNQILEKIKQIEKSNSDFAIYYEPIKKEYGKISTFETDYKKQQNIILRDDLESQKYKLKYLKYKSKYLELKNK